MKILLVTPPLTQLNTPYPATCHLVGFLRSQGLAAEQMDLSIELINALFTRQKICLMLGITKELLAINDTSPFRQAIVAIITRA